METPTRYIAKHSDAFSSYWTNPDSFLYGLLPAETQLDDASAYVPLYNQTDEIGDALVKEYMLPLGFSEGIGKIHQLMAQYPNLSEPVSENTRRFLDTIFTIPEWVDEELLLYGARFCNRTGTSGLATLRNYCLMGGYESSAINKPLIFTGALKKGAVKRLTDTVVFWVNVTEQNGLKIKNKGFFSTVTTRLIHSYSRLKIEETGIWKTSEWGKPLNIWDMLATNLGFSIAFLDGLHKLGFRPSEKEIKGVLHLWKYTGYLIGIPPAILPDTPQQAAQQLFYWSRTQKGADKDSVALAKSLYKEPLDVTFTRLTFMKKFVQNTNLGYNYFMLGSKSCKQLGLPPARMVSWIVFIRKMNRFNERLTRRFPSLYTYFIKKGRKQHIHVMKLYNKEK